jgi:hypothetical protein
MNRQHETQMEIELEISGAFESLAKTTITKYIMYWQKKSIKKNHTLSLGVKPKIRQQEVQD